jgi:Zn-dependent peptidase ImmA (M78 family)
MANVVVNPDLLRWAIERSGLSMDKLYKKFPKLDAWLTAENHPTFRQLENFARMTMTPFGVMFLNEPPEEKIPVPDFRTVRDDVVERPSPDLSETIQLMQLRQMWMREWLNEQGNESLKFVGSADVSRNPKSLAQEIRQTLDLNPEWAEQTANWEAALTTLRRAMERIGILVFSNSVVGLNNHRPLDPEEFRGFVLCDDIAPLVFINDADSKSARMFTLAHELVHLWLGTGGIFNLIKMLPVKDPTERFCNEVAAEFLVPEFKLNEAWPEARKASDRFSLLAKQFKVSPVVVARRAMDLKLISKPEFFRFYEADRKDFLKRRQVLKKNDKSGGNFYATQNSRLGRPFSAAIVRATREGRILMREAYRLTGMKGQTFETYAQKVLERVRNERE